MRAVCIEGDAWRRADDPLGDDASLATASSCASETTSGAGVGADTCIISVHAEVVVHGLSTR